MFSQSRPSDNKSRYDAFSHKSSNCSKTPMERDRIMAPLEYQKKKAAMAEKKVTPAKQKKKEDVTIAEMLATVRDIWFELDKGRGVIELEIDAVAFKLCAF